MAQKITWTAAIDQALKHYLLWLQMADTWHETCNNMACFFMADTMGLSADMAITEM